MLDILKVFILSLVEGLTEFIPVSSTGHLILVNEFIKLEPDKFANIFAIVIQLGAIMSVLVLYFNRLNPFSFNKDVLQKQYTIQIWAKVFVATLPAAVLGFIFDDFIDEKLMNIPVVTISLFLWGLAIIFIEKKQKKINIKSIQQMPYKVALMIGFAQCLALIPGTSRSAATIIGAMLLSCSRTVAAEFSFFLAIPIMFGASGLKIIKIFINKTVITHWQIFLIILGMFFSFIFATIVINKFMGYVKKNNFIVFGLYRVALSLILIIYILLSR